MEPRPQNPSFSRWAVLLCLVCASSAGGLAQQMPGALPLPDRRLQPRPAATPAPAPPARVPEELSLIPLPRATPPPRREVAPPGVFPTAFSMIPRAPQLPLLPLPPAFASPAQPPPPPSTAPLLRERFAEARFAGSRLNVRERAAEVPLGLQRNSRRDPISETAAAAYTLRAPATGEFAAQMNFGLLTEIRYSQNLDGVPAPFAREDTVIESTPQIRLVLGSPPGPRGERSVDSELYLQAEYLPTVRQLLGAGTSRTLQRVRGELGRANPISTAAIRFEYDENLFALGGLDSPEDSYTLLELAPRLEYRPSARTALRALGTYDRIRVASGATDRTDYILDLSFAWSFSPKTLLGAGVELRHLVFDADDLGEVDYEYSYLAATWRPTAKLLLQTRAGVELRQLDRASEPRDHAEPAATILLNWLPSEVTSVSAGFRARNQPSVTGRGELYRDLRFGLEATHNLAFSLYLRGELILRQRDYETGRREFECTVRPAIGYRPLAGKLLDSLRIELFFQHRTLDSNVPGSDFDQETVGLQSLIAF